MKSSPKLLFSMLAVALILGGVRGALAADDAPNKRVTFYKDVLPILQENCQDCHRPEGLNLAGMIAPMSFMTYQETRPWAKSIAQGVQSKAMPPWHAGPEFSKVFKNERVLTDQEIATIARWVKSGAPSGRSQDAPPPVVWPSGEWSIGEPDLIISFDEPFMVEDAIEDLYQNITVDIPEMDGPRWIKGVEFKPGSPVVHHIIGYAVSGEEGLGRGDRGMVGGIAPGNDPDTLPEGYGIPLPAKGQFIFAMHYHKEAGPGTATADNSQVAFTFYDKGAEVKEVQINSVGNRGGWEIPPYHNNWKVGSARTFDRDILLISMMPHMHLRGKRSKYIAYYPDGTREILLDVPRYDFNWQESYNFSELKLLPKGTRLENEMWFDNSLENSSIGGFNPARPVRFGGPTTDEMDLAWITYAYADDDSQ